MAIPVSARLALGMSQATLVSHHEARKSTPGVIGADRGQRRSAGAQRSGPSPAQMAQARLQGLAAVVQ